jgi:hypothetical protein
MSRTYRDRAARPWARAPRAEFRCRHCRTVVGPLPSGGHHRNHCPLCLYSRHVDGPRPGDRASTCGASMAPLGAYCRRNGEHVIVHRCDGCGFERHNRIAADDDFVLVLRLPPAQPLPVRRSVERRLGRSA